MAEFPLFVGKRLIGRIVQHGPDQVEAFDLDGALLGRFDGLGEAIMAVPVPPIRVLGAELQPNALSTPSQLESTT